ncbi:hypothetical protein LMG28690_06055 [Paraburkholderia caffeinilytica]|nr:hypothetical protein LMG28690_06055 [Paraburkholderia caffeinilytica]
MRNLQLPEKLAIPVMAFTITALVFALIAEHVFLTTKKRMTGIANLFVRNRKSK